MERTKAALRVPPTGALGGEAVTTLAIHGVAELVRAARLSRFGSRGAMSCHPIEYGEGGPSRQPGLRVAPPRVYLARNLRRQLRRARSRPVTRALRSKAGGITSEECRASSRNPAAPRLPTSSGSATPPSA